MLPLITTKIKDNILQWLSENATVGSSYQVDLPALQEAIGVDMDEDSIEAIFEDFQEMGLISDLNAARFGTFLTLSLRVKAHTFIQRGGFAVEDALNEANIQKILLELENLQKQLKPDQVDAINKVASIASSIATILTAFSTKS